MTQTVFSNKGTPIVALHLMQGQLETDVETYNAMVVEIQELGRSIEVLKGRGILFREEV